MAKKRDFVSAVDNDLNNYEATSNITSITPAQNTGTLKDASTTDETSESILSEKTESKTEIPKKKPVIKKKQLSIYLPEEIAEAIKAPIRMNKDISQYLIKLIEEDLQKNHEIYQEFLDMQRKFGIDI